MPAPEEAFGNSKQLIGEAIGQQVAESLAESSLGVLVESPPTFDPDAFIDALDRSSEYRIGLATVNISEIDIDSLRDTTSGTSIRASDELATAIEWRNQEETGLSWNGAHIPDRIVVLVRGDPARLNSLHRLYDLPLGEIRQQITSIMSHRPEFVENPKVQELWEALGDGSTANLSIDSIAQYSTSTIQDSPQASIEALGTNLHVLGLFPDSNLLTGDVQARLETNNANVRRVLHLSNRDRRRLMNSIQMTDSDSEYESQASLVERLRRFQRTHDEDILAEVEFDTVTEALETTSKSVTRSAGEGVDDADTDVDGKSTEQTTDRQSRRYDRRYDDSTVGVELTFAGEMEEVEEIADQLAATLPKNIEESEDQTEITYGENNKVVIDVDSDVYHFLQRFIDEGLFGGIIEDETEWSEAIENIGSLPTTKFRPRDSDSSIDKLRGFAQQNPDFESVVNEIDQYFEKREELIEGLPQLVHSPLIALLGDTNLLNSAQEYLKTYQSAQNKLDKNYRILQDASPSGATELLSEFLLFDTIILESESSREMILSPLHPLHLWKYVELALEISDANETLTQEEKQFLEESVDEQPHVLNNLSIGGGRYLDEQKFLIQSDELQRLPIYTEVNQAEPGTNTDLWNYLVEKFTSAYPPARSRLKLAVVDPLDPSDLLHKISKAAQKGDLEGAIIEFCYISSSHKDILRGATSAQEEDILTVFGPQSDFDQFTVKTRDTHSLDQYAELLKEQPQHCVVVNDNGQFQVEEFERDPNTRIHPLYIPKEFDYDSFQDEIQIRASAEGKLFSEFQTLINQLFNTRTKLHRSGVHSLEIDQELTTEFLDGSIWTIISTPSTNIDPFWESNLISKERRGDRNYGIYSQDFELFTRTLNRLLREYPIAPTDVDTNRLATRIAELQNSGLLRLITEETLGHKPSRNTQGLLGSVLALQWLEENFDGPKLIFSIDDPRTRRWLNFGDANRRADFVVAQIDKETGIDLNIVEIKTLSEPDEAFSIDESTDPPTVTGSAVDQVTATVDTIRGLFDGEENVTKQPRREALREQLYFELVGTDLGGVKSTWVNRLNEVFRGDAELRVNPHIVSVELNESDDSAIQRHCSTESAQQLTVSRIPRRTVVRLIMNGSDAEVVPQTPDVSNDDRSSPSETLGTETLEDPDSAPTSDDEEKEDIDDQESSSVKETQESSEGNKSVSDDSDSKSEDSGDNSAEPPTTFGKVEQYRELTEDLKRVLSEFGIKVRDIPESELDIGPNVIRYKVELAPGEEQGKLQRRSEDIAREMALDHEPIIHHIAGTHYVAIDIPRSDREMVNLYDYLNTLPDKSEITVGELPYIAGVEPDGAVKIADIKEAPHMLVGGATGSGKTVFLRSMLACILERQPIDQTEMAIIDPKQTDFIFCNDLPNLKTGSVITDSENAHDLFDWIVEDEIPRRTNVLTESGSIDINDHNKRSDDYLKPFIIIVDEYADLLDSLGEQSDAFETQVRRIAQRARNVGIHLVIATQRPSAKIIDTDLRSNLKVRVAFRVPSSSDSQVILDETGAEGLVGAGDMLFKEADNKVRLQGTLIEPDELRDLVNQLK